MSLPNTLNSLPDGARIQIEDAVRSGGITPPSQNFALPLVWCGIRLCAALYCRYLGTTVVCGTCAVGAAACIDIIGRYPWNRPTLPQIQDNINRLKDLLEKQIAKCAAIDGASDPGGKAMCLEAIRALEAMLEAWREALLEYLRRLGLGEQRDAPGIGEVPMQ